MRRSVVLGSMVLWVLSLVSLGWPMAKDVADIEATLNSEKDGFTSEKATKDINEQIVKLSKSTIGNVWLKMSAPKQIRPGFTAPIDISIWNIGGQVIQNLVVLSRAPNFMDVNIGDSLYTWLVSGSIRSTGPTIDTTIIDVNASSQKLKTITWHVPELPIAVNPEDTIKLHYELLVDSTLTSSIKLKNDIILTSQGQFLLSDVVVMEILLLPDFQVRKWANFDVLHPGQVGQFTICYRNNGYKDAEDVRIWDVLPEGLTFLDTLYLSHADTFWIIPGPPDTLVWFDYVVPKYAGGETGWHYIRFPFRVDVSRSDCPVNLLNEGALVWGKRTFPFRTRIAVITEPDIVPKILSLKTDRPRSPGRLVSIQAFIKNIGGTNVTSNFKVKFSYSKWNNGLQKPIPIEKTIVTCSPQAPLPAGGQDSVLVSVSTLWVPPGLGRYSIYVNADCDSQITEIHEVDPTYPFNNIDSTEVIVGVDSIN
ncbi:MAG: hypothetical protein ONB05_08805, partial [candidate division KSB1 bacterium]|nr:hypothetical protein [candidate division KSB1 bacterium]